MATPPMVETTEHGTGPCCSRHDNFGKKILMVLVAVLLVYGTLYLGTLMRINVKKYNYVGQADQMERTITINGLGKVNGKNDIAVTTIGFTTTDKDVAKAQSDNTKVMNQIIAELKKMGIADKDLQSDYSIYPEYDYTDKGQQFKGYRVSNNVTVKIRDLTKISTVLSLPGKFGANQVNGLSFTIDDTEILKTAAREKALANAKAKAAALAQSLGVELGDIVSYSDYDSPTDYQPYGGSMMYEKAVSNQAAPEVTTGSKDVAMSVSITYKILPR